MPEMNANILMLFAPKFNEFGCDVGKEYLRRKGGGFVHGLCAGPPKVKQMVETRLGAEAGKLWHLHTEEASWLTADYDARTLSEVDDELGAGAVGRIIVSDRRVGRGFVRGGLCRPDDVSRQISKYPNVLPQKYISGLYCFLDRMLKTIRPDMVFCYAVAGAPALLLAEMAKARRIPFSRITSIRLGNRYVIDDDPKGRLSCIDRRFRASGEDKSVVQEAQDLLQSFRNAPEPPGYMIRNKVINVSKTPFRMTVRAISGTVYHSVQSIKDQRSRSERIKRDWFEALISWRRFLSRKLFSDSPPNKVPFVYYPLHVDPESSTQVLAPMHTDQLSVIEALAKSVPANLVVVVKEHEPMLGRRPKGFYEKIMKMPRVVLLGPEHTGLSLIGKAEIVTVITGTAAWEAIRLRKPVVIIGDSPYLSIGEGLIYEPSLANLSTALSAATKLSPASDDKIVKYLAASLSVSFEMNPSILWGEYLRHSSSERNDVVSNIVNGIIKREQEQSGPKPK